MGAPFYAVALTEICPYFTEGEEVFCLAGAGIAAAGEGFGVSDIWTFGEGVKFFFGTCFLFPCMFTNQEKTATSRIAAA